jgi:tRNA A37 methylthiotransferase MiaB
MPNSARPNVGVQCAGMSTTRVQPTNMTVHLVNPSHLSFGVGVITPRWLFVLAGATPASHGDPRITDETLEPFDLKTVQHGDVVGLGIHTGNALRGYELGTAARARGAVVVYGGIHATLYPEEAQTLGGAHAVVKGDGDQIWPVVLDDVVRGTLQPIYEAGRIDADQFVAARWDLLPEGRYMWGSVQTVRGCPKHCSFCSVWRTDGQKPRQRGVDAVVGEIVELRRRGFRFVALADDNFYPVTLTDLAMAERQGNQARLEQLRALRAERFELMDRLAQLPSDMIFFTQITMEAAEDDAFLDAMRRAHIKGALVGVEAVTPEGLKDVYKGFNHSGEALVTRLRMFRERGVHVLGSFIFGLPSDRPSTFEATADIADRAGLTFAQFVMLTPYPGTVDFAAWEKSVGSDAAQIAGIPVTRHWLIPQAQRPKVYAPHPVMSPDEIRTRTQGVWDQFYSLPRIWARSRCTPNLRARVAFVLISKLYRQMYANTGIATDSARVNRANRWARVIAKPCRHLFTARPMPDLTMPSRSA